MGQHWEGRRRVREVTGILGKAAVGRYWNGRRSRMSKRSFTDFRRSGSGRGGGRVGGVIGRGLRINPRRNDDLLLFGIFLDLEKASHS